MSQTNTTTTSALNIIQQLIASSSSSFPNQYTDTKRELLKESSHAAPSRPEYIRLPKPGHLCPYTGLCRSTLNNLILPTKQNNFKPPVVSRSIRLGRGQLRGVRLIKYDSLIQYLETCLAIDTKTAKGVMCEMPLAC